MQYSNRENIQGICLAMKFAMAVLTMLLVIAVFGWYPLLHSALPVMLAVWTLCLLVGLFGGFDELYVNVGQGYVEVLRRRFLSLSEHREVVISTKSENLYRVKYTRFAYFRFARIYYKGHTGTEKRIIFGLTMMDRQKRRDLIEQLRTICNNNKAI